jgi:hypothetical protein
VAREDESSPDHLQKPGRNPVDGLVATGAASLDGHEKILVAELVDGDRQVRIAPKALVLGAGEVVTSLEGSKELDRQRRQRMATSDNTTLTTELSRPAHRPTVSSWVKASSRVPPTVVSVPDQETATELPSRLIRASSMPCRCAVASSMS